MVAALKVIEVMIATGRPLSGLRGALKKFPQRTAALTVPSATRTANPAGDAYLNVPVNVQPPPPNTSSRAPNSHGTNCWMPAGTNPLLQNSCR